jgi:hypothetical protein
MWEDNDDDDFNFNFDDLSPEEKAEIEREMKEKEEYRRNHPLFKQANKIYSTVDSLLASFKEGSHAEMYGDTMMSSAMMLAPKLAGAIGSESWLLCMQNASLIRYHAEHLLTSTSGLKMFDEEGEKGVDSTYVQILREEVLEFQRLFRDWVKEINRMEHEEYVDEWGLFIREK